MKKSAKSSLAALALAGAALLAGCAPASSASSASSVSGPPASASACAPAASSVSAAPAGSEAGSDSYAAAPGPAYAMDGLWEQLAAGGKVWMPVSPDESWQQMGGFAYPVLSFSSRGDGGYELAMYSAYGSGSTRWVFSRSSRDETGAYRLTAEQTDSEGAATVYLDGCGPQLELVLYEDGRLDVALERQAVRMRFVENEMLYPLLGGYYEATALDEAAAARLNEQADEYGRVTVSEDEYLLAGGEVLALETWRAVSEEELQAALG